MTPWEVAHCLALTLLTLRLSACDISDLLVFSPVTHIAGSHQDPSLKVFSHFWEHNSGIALAMDIPGPALFT